MTAGILLGSMPVLVYHWLTLTPPVPSSPWDTRACLLFPGPATCDGKYPTAPSDLVASRPLPPGNGACLTGETHMVNSTPIPNDNQQHLGTIDLWWSPPCQSSFAHVELL